ncbi:MAG: hypothetical protein IK014_02930 [Lachnospiraceae bacterium]|nr:hypothetical protein [Lachnospiraceae bacterium]
MGTGYKGGSSYYRSVGQNILITSSHYEYKNGRFGVSSPSTGQRTRNIGSSDPLSTAKDFYDKIAFGGIEKTYKNGQLNITHMADGTIISMRTYSHSDGTPVVEININNSTHTGGIKEQKIHFIKE